MIPERQDSTTRSGPETKNIGAAIAGMASRSRHVTESDVPAVLELHRRVLGKHASAVDPARQEKAFLEIYLNERFHDECIRPLLYQEDDGKIGGFLGLIPQPVRFKGRNLRCAVSAHFCVDPGSRGFAGHKLLTAFLAGPQDLSIADEANDATRKLWEWFGGTTVFLQSLSWTLALQPVRLGLNLAANRLSGLARLRPVLRPIAALADGLIAVARRSSRTSAPELTGEELDCATLLRCRQELSDDKLLQPQYGQRFCINSAALDFEAKGGG